MTRRSFSAGPFIAIFALAAGCATGASSTGDIGAAVDGADAGDDGGSVTTDPSGNGGGTDAGSTSNPGTDSGSTSNPGTDSGSGSGGTCPGYADPSTPAKCTDPGYCGGSKLPACNPNGCGGAYWCTISTKVCVKKPSTC
jgi:hypothetical protein